VLLLISFNSITTIVCFIYALTLSCRVLDELSFRCFLSDQLPFGCACVRVCVIFHRFASKSVFWLRRVNTLSADSRPMLCGTDTLCSRCVGCNRDFSLQFFKSNFEAPIHPPLWSPIWSFTSHARSLVDLLIPTCNSDIDRLIS
jgi:hypothetical protein